MTNIDRFEENMRRLQGQIEKFGWSRRPLQTEFNGERAVVAGSAIYKIPLDWGFVDFLLSYGLDVFGRTVVNAEADRKNPKHPMAKLLLNLEAVASCLENGRVKLIAGSLELDAFIRLSWDLFTVADNAQLQMIALKRLSVPDQYQGARYELTVAASFIRAGFKLEFEDEGDVLVSHCEFTATHKQSSKSFSVEAKSRHRSEGDGHHRVGIRRLLQKALSKAASHERLVFVDVNLPHDLEITGKEPWLHEVGETILALEKQQSSENPWPSAVIFFTNGTFALSEQGGGRLNTVLFTAINHTLFLQQDLSAVSEQYPELLILHDALIRLGNPPIEFPGS